MGHGMSQPEEEEEEEEGGGGAGAPQTWSTDANISPGSGQPDDVRPPPLVGQDISHLTKLRSAPSEMCLRLCPRAWRETYVSTTRMLTGREANVSGRGRFSSSECGHVLSRYLPSAGPWPIDKMRSKAYVSQFSADGTLFVAGFQVKTSANNSLYFLHPYVAAQTIPSHVARSSTFQLSAGPAHQDIHCR